MQTQDPTIVILSLVVAAAAVFVGPIVSWITTRQQLESARRIATTQLIAPFRQAWINDLRTVMTELLSSVLRYRRFGLIQPLGGDHLMLAALHQRLELMLNPAEQQHKKLLALVEQMLTELTDPPSAEWDERLSQAHKLAHDTSRAILKSEWERVKLGELTH